MRHVPGYLDRRAQEKLLADIVERLRTAPFFTPVMPRWGTPFSVRMSNFGALGWVSDKSGYRYQAVHPVTGEKWPDMPPVLRAAWDEITGFPAPPEACLVNYYTPGAKMGMHQDRDETDFDAPVLSLSLGDSAWFRIGGVRRDAPSRRLLLASGDAMTLEGASRLAFHGIDRVIAGSSDLLAQAGDLFPEGGRINLTLRRVSAFAPAAGRA